MSVYVRGMEMPRCCNDCRFAVYRMQPNGVFNIQCQALEEGDDDWIDSRGEGRRKRLDNCPLEEQP